VLRIDVGRGAAGPLRVRDDVERQRRFTARLGPKISVTRPRGMPPMPIAASRLIAPVGMALIRTCGESAPMRMIEPLPQVFSIWVIARLSAFRRSSVSLVVSSAMIGLDMGCEPL